MLRPVVHVGMAKAASTFLQRDVFGHLPGVRRVGKHGVGADVKSSFQAISRRVDALYHDKQDELIAPLKTAVADAIQRGQRPILSDENFSVYRYLDPATMAARLREILGAYDVVLIVRDAESWLRSQYLFRLQRHDATAVRGFSQWLQHHYGPPRIGSDMGELWFAHLSELYKRHCGGDVYVLSYSALSKAPERFAADLGVVVGVPASAIEARLKIQRHARRHKHAIGQSHREFLEALVWVDRSQPARLVDAVRKLSNTHNLTLQEDAVASLQKFSEAPERIQRSDWADLLDAILEEWGHDDTPAALEFPAGLKERILRHEAAQLARLSASEAIHSKI